jgi:hypothetical protein
MVDDHATAPDAPASSPVAAAQEEPTTYYGSADEFVRKQLIGTYRRRVIRQGSGGGLRWKAAWWESKEAQQRIEALRRAWEAARADEKAGMSIWWINHCDPNMSVLLSQDGPFADSTDENRIGESLPYAPPSKDCSSLTGSRRYTPSVQPPKSTKLRPQTPDPGTPKV